MKINLRFVAAKIIQDVISGRSLSDVLSEQGACLSDRDAAFVQALMFGVCRYYPRLLWISKKLSTKQLKSKDTDLFCLILVGLYQLLLMRVPPHAVLSETVNAADHLKKTWSKGFINAVLRRFLREKETLLQSLQSNEEAYFAHPKWWITAIQNDWPKHFKEILQANNELPPLAIRVNLSILSREDYLKILESHHIKAHILPHTEAGLIIENPKPIESFPKFSEGAFSVQDGASQLVAPLLALQPEFQVLDACSAPGGKLTHFFEIVPRLKSCVAVEKSPQRMEKLIENLKRLHLHDKVITKTADILDFSAKWDGRLFDRILLDAPCSASGVVRRHPDIKILKTASDIPHLAKMQLHFLKHLWPLLKPGGVLLYTTCSVFKEENSEVVKRFLELEKSASEEKIHAPFGILCEFGKQILPGMNQMDGFYFAKLKKCEDGAFKKA